MSPEAAPVPADIGTDARRVVLVVALVLACFGFWGVFAQLDAGAIAVGEVVPAGRVRTVQHHEGGIIGALLVRDGDRVKAGAELLRIDDTELRAQVEIAERELAGYRQRLAEVRREAQGWAARQESLRHLAANAEEERRLHRGLYEQKFISRPRLLQLESQAAQHEALIGENTAELARAQQRLAEIEAAAAATRERRAALLQRLARTRVLAPQDGVVNNLRYATLGGVIPPGGAILDIVPDGEELLVEAKILPDDIDVVRPGLESRIKLTAYKARSHIMLKGRVVMVSQNTFRDDAAQGRSYYKARIAIDAAELERLGVGALVPGMQAQVDIVSGQRSALRYFLDPILDSFRRAFKEA